MGLPHTSHEAGMNFRSTFAAALAAGLGLLCGCASVKAPAGAEISPFRIESKDDGTERLVTDVRINGRPARLFLDTGAAAPVVLFAPSLERLGLKVAREPAGTSATPGKVVVGRTVATTVQMLGWTARRAELAFVNLPRDLPLEIDGDGLMGWPAVSGNVMVFAFSGKEPFIGAGERPNRVEAGWQTFTVTDDATLSLQPASGRRGPRLIVDTGHDGGVMLPPARWREWRAAHPDVPVTIDAGWMFGGGASVHEVAWAEEIAIGDLVFRGVPVEEALPAYWGEAATGENVVALGVAALKRLDLIVDARAHVAQATALTTPSPDLPHNRTGVLFAPKEGAGDDLFAHVLAGGPAFRAGVRDGDVLVKVNGREVAGWREWPDALRRIYNSRAPAGTTWEFTVRRDGDLHTVSVVAENLIGPARRSAR
jgi:hypothetical protein